MIKTDLELARHEACHALAAAVAMHAMMPEHAADFLLEVELQPQKGEGHTVLYHPAELDGKAAPELLPRVHAITAAGPLLCGSINELRDVLRAKQLPLGTGLLSAVDEAMLIRNGGPDLSIKECEVITAAAKLCHGAGLDTVARALCAARALVMPVTDWLPAHRAKRLLLCGGPDFMKLHSRHESMPDWAADWVQRAYTAQEVLHA